MRPASAITSWARRSRAGPAGSWRWPRASASAPACRHPGGDFAAPLAFIAMTIPLLRDRAMVAAAAVAAITVVSAHALPLKLSVPLAALAGIAAGLTFERSWR